MNSIAQIEGNTCRGQWWELVRIEGNTPFWSDFSGQNWVVVNYSLLTVKVRGNNYANLIKYVLWVTNESMHFCDIQWIVEWVNLYISDKLRFVGYMIYWK